MSLIIVDTGCANISSVAVAFERLGVVPKITKDIQTIQSADRVIFPGVGSAVFSMQSLNEYALVPVLQSLTQPVLGICLGMQLLFARSDEGGVDMLGIISETIKRLNTGTWPSPHMGWNTLGGLADDPILHGVRENDYAYFVHSFSAPIGSYTVATSEYGDLFSAIIRKDNFYGCQFHPERSSDTGAKILKNFLEIYP